MQKLKYVISRFGINLGYQMVAKQILRAKMNRKNTLSEWKEILVSFSTNKSFETCSYVSTIIFGNT